MRFRYETSNHYYDKIKIIVIHQIELSISVITRNQTLTATSIKEYVPYVECYWNGCLNIIIKHRHETTGMQIFMQIDILLDIIKEMKLEQEFVSSSKSSNECFEYFAYLCTLYIFLHFQILNKCIKVKFNCYMFRIVSRNT